MRKLAAFLVIAVAVGALFWWLLQRQHGKAGEFLAHGGESAGPPSVAQRALDVALIQAAFRIDTPRVAELIRNGASTKARYGDSGPEDFKVDGGSPIAADRWTALLALAHSDAAGDRVPLAKVLLDAGADINADDSYGNTALAECCYMNRESLTLFLLERGANPNTRTGVYIDGTGDIAPVHRATQNPTILLALIKYGADVNVLDDTGDSPLDWAARYSEETWIRDGRTGEPARYKKREVVQMLTDAGARRSTTLR